MDKTWVLFDNAGRITDTLSLNEAVAPPFGALELVAGVMMADIDYYVDTQTMTIKEKTLLLITSSVNGLFFVITNVPMGTYLSVADNSLLVDDGVAELEFDTPGTYVVNIDPPPQYKAEELEVTVG